MALIQGPQKPGMRVGEIRVQTHLSRPAVSHHLKILKDAQIISVHKEGTRNFYRLDAGSKLRSLKNLVSEIDKLLNIVRSQPWNPDPESMKGTIFNETYNPGIKRSPYSATRIRSI